MGLMMDGGTGSEGVNHKQQQNMGGFMPQQQQ